MPATNKMAGMLYWVEKAHTTPEARALASRLNLDLPNGEMSGFKSGMVYPIRRLVVTGEDTPENFAILFGPSWKTSMSDIHREQRIQVLLGSQPGSPAQIMGGYLDEGCPTPNPRPASEDEKEELQMYSRGLAHLG